MDQIPLAEFMPESSENSNNMILKAVDGEVTLDTSKSLEASTEA